MITTRLAHMELMETVGLFSFACFSSLRRFRRTLLTLFAIVLVTGAFTVLLAAQEMVSVTVEGALNTYWRGPYDLLVRPPETADPVETEQGLIRPNGILNIQGGIGFAQWQDIKRMPEVEVAAPVAVLGYTYQGALSPREVVRDPGIYRLTRVYTVDTGVRAVSRAETEFDGILGAEPRDANRRLESREASSYGLPYRSAPASFANWFELRALIAAVDPESEAQLLGLDQAVVEGSYLDAKAWVVSSPVEVNPGEWRPSFKIPVLFNRETFTNVTLESRYDRLVLPEPAASELGAALAGGRVDGSAVQQQIRSGMSPNELPGASWTPVSRWDGSVWDAVEYFLVDLKQRSVELEQAAAERGPKALASYLGSSYIVWLLPRPIRFTTVEPPFADSRPGLAASPVGVDEFGQPAFREIVNRGQPFQISPRWVGTIDLRLLDPNNLGGPLVALPPEIYTVPRAQLVAGPDGKPLAQPVDLLPGISLSDYQLRPPLMLTTIQAVREMPLGAPISAIRVRVKLDGWNDAEQAKLERVAAEIAKRTGLRVDIVTGSSPTEVLVNLPGKDGAPGIGWIKELWIKKGANLAIARLVQTGDTWVFAPIVLVASLFVGTATVITTLARRTEIGVLKGVGWSGLDVVRALLGEGLAVTVMGALLGLGLAWGVATASGFPFPWGRATVVFPLALVVSALGLLVSIALALRVPPIQTMRFGEISARRARRPGSADLTLGRYVARAASQTSVRSWLTVVMLALAGGFFTVLALSIQNAQSTMAVTLLGRYIAVRIQPYHFAMVALALGVAMIGTADLFLANLERRRAEVALLRSVGWGREKLGRLFLLEAAGVGLVSGLAGSVLGWTVFQFGLMRGPSLIGALKALFRAPGTETLLGGLAPGLILALAALVPVAAALMAAVPTARRASAIDPVSVLRAE